MQEMGREFRFHAPSEEEQKAFTYLLGGTLLAVVILVALFFWQREPASRALAVGACLALCYRLYLAARELEFRGQRAAQAAFTLYDDFLEIRDARGQTSRVPWGSFKQADLRGGRLKLTWPDGTLEIGARELQDGMSLTQEIARRISGPQSTPLFIPLTPKDP